VIDAIMRYPEEFIPCLGQAWGVPFFLIKAVSGAL